MALTKAQLLSLVAANLPDNITQQITPSLHRQVLNEAIDAMYPVPTQPIETLPAYNPLTTYQPGPNQYVIFNDLIWRFISATAQTGVEPGTNAAVWQEITLNELAHIQNTDLRLGDYLALVEEDGPTIDMCDGAFSDSIYLVNNIFVFWPATNGAERPYSLKTVGTRRLTHTFIVMVHPSYLGSLKFESDANQVIGDEALILEPGEFAVFKGALGGPAIAAPKTQLLYKGGTSGITDVTQGNGIQDIHPRPAFIEGTFLTNVLHTWVFGSTSRTISANILMMMPFVVYADTNLKIDQIGINVTSAATSGTYSADISIYSSQGGKPHQRLTETTVTGLDTTGYKSGTIDFTFSKGVLYWIGIVAGCGCTVSAISSANAMFLGLSAGDSTVAFQSLRRPFTYGDRLPSTWTWSDDERNTNVAVSIRFRVALSTPT